MYIKLKNNAYTKDIIESLKAFGEEVEVREYSVITFVRMDTSNDSIVACLVNITDNVIRIYSRQDYENYFDLNLSNVYTIYSL